MSKKDKQKLIDYGIFLISYKKINKDSKNRWQWCCSNKQN